MEIIRDKENKIINIRIWTETENEDGFLTFSDDISGDVIGNDPGWAHFMRYDNHSTEEILEELDWWKEEIELWNRDTNHEGGEIIREEDETYYMTVEVENISETGRIYMVEDIDKVETYITVCKDKEEANRAALEQWESLTKMEQKHRRVHVIYTEKTSEYYDPEDPCWEPEAFHSCKWDDDDFDSDKIED